MKILFLIFAVALASDLYFFKIREKIMDAQCIQNLNMEVLLRGYMSIGKVDPNFQYNLDKLVELDIDPLAYFTPCPKCGNPTQQIKDFLNIAKYYVIKYVIDLTHPTTWFDEVQKNIDFLSEILKELGHYRMIGIMTNKEMFTKIFGNNFNIPRSVLLYLKPDNSEVCDEIDPFGGYKKMDAKIYQLGQAKCQMKVDLMSVCDESELLSQ